MVASPAVTPNTILVRASGVELHFGDADDVSIVRGDERAQTTPHALDVLAAFAHPRTIGEVLGGAAEGAQDWLELSATIHQLARAGILVEPSATGAPPRGYACPPIHIAMLDDEVRTLGFIHALRAIVGADDQVLDIGTGTGVLATVAALAGAAHVSAVESSAIADTAERVFASNGVTERVTLVRGRSTRVTLPTRCSVLVTEIIGNDPLDEQLLETVEDAKRRLLTPDARIIPSGLEIFAIPVELPQRIYGRRAFTADRIAAWTAMYGVDFSELMAVRQSDSQPFAVRTEEAVTWPSVAPPVSLVAIDLESNFEVSFERQVVFTLERDVERLGILLGFRATLAPGIVLSTLPDEVSPDNHWRFRLWASEERPSFARGETATIEYRYGRGTTSLTVR
jgi:hypothetical protein